MIDTLVPELAAFGQVIMIDLVLAGDNAIVIGLAVAGIAPDKRKWAMIWGIAAAVVLRIAFALATTQLLDIQGVTLLGGLLLTWVCVRLWFEIRRHGEGEGENESGETATAGKFPRKSLLTAVWEIVLADVSMSLDNVLAVAGAAQDYLWVLVLGLLASVTLMGAAAALIAKLLNRYAWISYAGLAIIAYVALRMITDGSLEIMSLLQAE